MLGGGGGGGGGGRNAQKCFTVASPPLKIFTKRVMNRNHFPIMNNELIYRCLHACMAMVGKHAQYVVSRCRPFPFFGAGERVWHRAIGRSVLEARENHTMNFISEHMSSNFYSRQLFSNTPYKQPKPVGGNKSCWTYVH